VWRATVAMIASLVDRKQTVDVQGPLYGIVTVVGTDRKKTEMKRGAFDELYEPVLATPNPEGVDLSNAARTTRRRWRTSRNRSPICTRRSIGWVTSSSRRRASRGRRSARPHNSQGRAR
jgi:hypothetical protein